MVQGIRGLKVLEKQIWQCLGDARMHALSFSDVHEVVVMLEETCSKIDDVISSLEEKERRPRKKASGEAES